MWIIGAVSINVRPCVSLLPVDIQRFCRKILWGYLKVAQHISLLGGWCEDTLKYVCVYVYMHAHMYVCITYVCIMYACILYVRMCVCIMYMSLCILYCVYVCIFMYTNTVYTFYFFEFLYNFLEPKSLCSKIIFGNIGLGATAQNFTEQIMYIYQCHLVDKTGIRPDWGVRDRLLNDIT